MKHLVVTSLSALFILSLNASASARSMQLQGSCAIDEGFGTSAPFVATSRGTRAFATGIYTWATIEPTANGRYLLKITRTTANTQISEEFAFGQTTQTQLPKTGLNVKCSIDVVSI